VMQGGFARQPRTISKGQRCSAATAFLRPARRRLNLAIATKTDVLLVVFEGRRACGVRVRDSAGERQIAASREVILSAGAIETPKLLQLSGVGPGPLLRSQGIEVRIDAPQVGANLREHRTVSIVYELAHGGHNAWLRGPGLYASIVQYCLFRKGALTSATFDLGGFVKTMPGLDRPDGQVGVGLFSFGAAGVSHRPGMTMFGYFLRPQSQGKIEIRSPDPSVPPYIEANYLATEADRAHTVSLMRYMRKIGSQPALAFFGAAEILPGPDCEGDQQLIDASFQFGSSGFHVAGTCRMGSDSASVVDPELKVRGVDGLRVVDTSIMPELVSGNTNAPAMAVAWRAAELIRGSAA